MKITDIKQQKKRAERYSIYLEGKYAFSLSESELMSSGIRIGKDYTQAELDKLKQVAVLDKARMRALDYIARRPRSRWEVEDYLKRKDYDSPTSQAILNMLSEYGYIDDQKFARSWVESRRLLKPTSLRRLKLELMQKHVDSEVIQEVLGELGEEDQVALQELVQKKRQQSRYQDPQKLIAYLLRQGFNYSDVRRVLDREAESEAG